MWIDRFENILSCRLVLNIRRAAHARRGLENSTFRLEFTSDTFLGNIGDPLRDVEECNELVEHEELER